MRGAHGVPGTLVEPEAHGSEIVWRRLTSGPHLNIRQLNSSETQRDHPQPFASRAGELVSTCPDQIGIRD